MAGLLEYLNTDQGRMGLGLLAAAGPRSDGAGFGQRLSEGLNGFDAYKQNQRKTQFDEMRLAQAQAEIEAAKQAAAMAQRKREGMPSLFTGGSPALSPLAGDASVGILPSQGRSAVSPRIDVQRGIELGFTPDELFKMDSLRNIGKDEVARTMKGMVNGREVEQQFDKWGRPINKGMEQFRAPIEMATGDKKQMLDPYTLQPKASFAMGQSPDSKASNAISWANNVATLRGQDLTDARARDRLALDQGGADGYSTKPLPAAALKMQNEAVDAIGAAGGINKILSKVEQQISDKKVKFGPISNLMNQGLNASGMSTEESRNFGSFKSDLEKLRNESLRLNSGVQTDGDAQRAWNELFQNINDTELVKQRLDEIKAMNNRAVELQKLKVDNIRGNYKAAPYDFGKLPDSVAAKPAMAPPQSAVNYLKMNPRLRNEFDAKYGTGASAQILGE